MFPLRDENPTLRFSLVTVAIIGANIAVWTTVQGLGAHPSLAESVCNYGLVPGELLDRLPEGTRVPIGPNLRCVLGAGAHSWFTPLTSMFLHGGWLHIIGNMWFLWVFGDNIEDSMGHGRFLLFYLLCGLAAAAAQMAADPASAVPMVGASGAIGGVMGAYAALYPRARVQTLVFLGFFVQIFRIPAVLMLGYWFVLQILGGIPARASTGGGVAFWAHAGGFLAGLVLIFAFRNPRLVAAHRAAVRFRS